MNSCVYITLETTIMMMMTLLCCSMCSCYIGTDVSSLVPVCPEQLLDTKFWRTPEYHNSPEYRNTGVPEHRSTGTPEYWNTGILSPESRKSSIPTFWKPLHFCSLVRGFNYSSVPGFRGFNYSGVPLLRGFIIFLGEH